jgi:hypothetical protein
MVFNNPARDLLRLNVSDTPISHDWWAYILVTGCGGHVFYDSIPTLRYRQHSQNVIGVNSTWLGRIRRLIMLFKGRFRSWNNTNIRALNSLEHLLTPENRRILTLFTEARDANLLYRLIKLRDSGVYRQTLFGNMSLVFAAILKKV